MKALFALALFATPALAAPPCTDAPKDKWLPQQEMKSRIVADGYKIKKFKVDGSCYEIYGWDKDSKKVEIYFNPVSGEIVKRKTWN